MHHHLRRCQTSGFRAGNSFTAVSLQAKELHSEMNKLLATN